METENIEKNPYYIWLPDPRGEVPEPWLAAASARVEAAAERIGLDVSYQQREDDDREIDWVTHAVGKGVRYNTRQWEMWLRRETIPAIERSTHA